MSDLSAFAITQKWQAQYPDRIQLYSLPTPNGVKVSIMLEETGLPYEPHLVSFDSNDQKTPEFLSLNPNGKIPAILDPNGPGGKPLPLFESGAILIYLADKSRLFLPEDEANRYATIQWLMFQMGGVGPMFGQVGFFTNLRAGNIQTNVRWTGTSANPNDCSPSLIGVSRTENGSWARTTASRILRLFPGSAISSASTMPAIL